MSRQARLAVVLVLNLVLVAGLAAVGLSAHSLGVLAEGADYLADAAAIGVSLAAIRLARRTAISARPASHLNATLYAALGNSGWLLVLNLLVAAGGIDRLATGTGIVRGLPVLVVSAIAAVVMLVGALILGGDVDDLDDDDDPGGGLNMRAVLLDTAADAAAAGGVAGAGAIIFATGRLYWLDPSVAIAVSSVVGWHALRLVRQVASRLSKPTTGPDGVRHGMVQPPERAPLDEWPTETTIGSAAPIDARPAGGSVNRTGRQSLRSCA